MKQFFIEYLLQHHIEFRKYFPETQQHHWISDQFNAHPSSNFTTEEEQLTDFS